MKEIIIRENEAQQRLDKFLKKYLDEAPGSFIYKMLRKKNITLNEKKADGSEKLCNADCVKLFLADATIEKFRSSQAPSALPDQAVLSILYEDANVLLVNKPVGMLSQKADKEGTSMVEYVTAYLLESGQLTEEEIRTFKPSVCNRLDRNTSGIIVAGKSLAGLQTFAQLFKDRTLRKDYLCMVSGTVDRPSVIQGYLLRNETTRKVRILEAPDKEGAAVPIETEYMPLAWNSECTLLKIHLITGRTHQIRAHLASTSHPVIGDYKYGDRAVNDRYKARCQVASQLLHAWRLELPALAGACGNLSGRVFYAPLPERFQNVIKETAWEHGTQEAFGVLP